VTGSWCDRKREAATRAGLVPRRLAPVTPTRPSVTLGGGIWRLRREWEKEKPRKWDFAELPETWIRIRTI
jgi:hypothetical protein